MEFGGDAAQALMPFAAMAGTPRAQFKPAPSGPSSAPSVSRQLSPLPRASSGPMLGTLPFTAQVPAPSLAIRAQSAAMPGSWEDCLGAAGTLSWPPRPVDQAAPRRIPSAHAGPDRAAPIGMAGHTSAASSARPGA